MKILIDLNIVLDVVLNREPWVAEAKQIWNAHQSGMIDGFLVATEITNLFYIVRRISGESCARRAVNECLTTFEIASVNHEILEDADHRSGPDFEDNVCIACGVAAGIDGIVTRDPEGFSRSEILVFSPAELISRLLLERQ